VLREDGFRRLDYCPGTAIHAVSRSKHVHARQQHNLQSHIVLVLDHVNPKDLLNKKESYLNEAHVINELKICNELNFRQSKENSQINEVIIHCNDIMSICRTKGPKGSGKHR